MPDEYLTPDEIARELRVHVTTIHRLLKAGRLRAVKVGHQWRVRRSDLDEYLRHSTEEARSRPES